MKVFQLLFVFTSASNLAQHYLINNLARSHDEKMMILMNPAFADQNFDQKAQMQMILPMLLMDARTNENARMLMMMVMQDPDFLVKSENQMLVAYLMNAEDDTLDFKTMFFMTNMFKKDCGNNGAQRLNSLMPLLLNRENDGCEESAIENILSIMMFSAVNGEGGLDSAAFMSLIMEEMIFEEGEFDHDRKMLMWVLMSMLSGSGKDQQGFNNNFNMMMPLLLRDCDDPACATQQHQLMVVMLAMQSTAPGTAFGPNMMIPLMLMGEDDNNQELMFFMMMQMNNDACAQPLNHVAHEGK